VCVYVRLRTLCREDVFISRMGMYDDTYVRSPSEGWMFVPIVDYHAGGMYVSICLSTCMCVYVCECLQVVGVCDRIHIIFR